MGVIVTDSGFGPEDWKSGFHSSNGSGENDAAGDAGVDLASSDDPVILSGHLDRIAMIRVDFPSFTDGRGFTIARRLRQMGFTGRLRARGHVIADQYAMARRSGFDEVEIDEALAARQPEDQWRARADWKAHDYQARMRG